MSGKLVSEARPLPAGVLERVGDRLDRRQLLHPPLDIHDLVPQLRHLLRLPRLLRRRRLRLQLTSPRFLPTPRRRCPSATHGDLWRRSSCLVRRGVWRMVDVRSSPLAR